MNKERLILKLALCFFIDVSSPFDAQSFFIPQSQYKTTKYGSIR